MKTFIEILNEAKESEFKIINNEKEGIKNLTGFGVSYKGKILASTNGEPYDFSKPSIAKDVINQYINMKDEEFKKLSKKFDYYTNK